MGAANNFFSKFRIQLLRADELVGHGESLWTTDNPRRSGQHSGASLLVSHFLFLISLLTLWLREQRSVWRTIENSEQAIAGAFRGGKRIIHDFRQIPSNFVDARHFYIPVKVLRNFPPILDQPWTRNRRFSTVSMTVGKQPSE